MSIKNKQSLSQRLFEKLWGPRQHPIKILGYTTRNFWLVLIPLTRDLAAARYDIASWLKGSWLSILTIAVIFGYAFIRWFTITYHIGDDCIIAKSGYFGLMESKIYYDRITTLSASQGPLYRPFRAHKVYLNTNSGFKNGSDIKLTMKSSDFKRLFGKLNPGMSDGTDAKGRFCYRPKRSQVFIFSLMFSSSLSGILIISTFLIQGSRIVDQGLQERIRLGIYDLTHYVEMIATNIPPIAIGISLIAITGWLMSFVANLLRHWSFVCIRRGNKIVIKSGFITKRFHILNRRSIVCADMQQSLLMKVFSICTVRIHCNGYGKSNREINVLIPITTLREMGCSMKLIIPEFSLPHKSIRPRVRGIMFYVLPPLLVCIALPCAATALIHLMPSWKRMVSFALMMFEFPCIWLTIVKLVSAFTTGAGIDIENNILRLDYCRWYKFHTVSIPVKQISTLSSVQSWAQFLKNNCNICVKTASISTKTYTAKNLCHDDATELFRKAGFDIPT